MDRLFFGGVIVVEGREESTTFGVCRGCGSVGIALLLFLLMVMIMCRGGTNIAMPDETGGGHHAGFFGCFGIVGWGMDDGLFGNGCTSVVNMVVVIADTAAAGIGRVGEGGFENFIGALFTLGPGLFVVFEVLGVEEGHF